MSEIEISRDAAIQPISARERLCVRLVLFLIALIVPCTYKHQLTEWVKEIKGDLVK